MTRSDCMGILDLKFLYVFLGCFFCSASTLGHSTHEIFLSGGGWGGVHEDSQETKQAEDRAIS